MIKSFGGCIWILLSNGAKWRSKPKLKMIWIVRSSAGGGAELISRRLPGATGAAPDQNLWKPGIIHSIRWASGVTLVSCSCRVVPMSVAAIDNFLEALPRRNVLIRRDGKDFVVVYESQDLVVFRNEDANALRKVCRFLRYTIVSDQALLDTEPQQKTSPA